MGPVTVVEFEHYVGAHRRILAAASKVLMIYVFAALMIEIPIALQVNKQAASFTRIFQVSTLQSIKLPKLDFTSSKALAATTTAADNAKLYKIIDDFAHTHPGSIKATTIDLTNSKRTVAYGGDDAMMTASTYKMFAAYVALGKVEQGTLSLTTPVGSGTLDSCIQKMILISDNPCGEAVGGKLGWTELTKIVNAAGFTNTKLDGTGRGGYYYSTANDEAQFMSRLQAGKLLNAEHTQYLIDLMKRQVLRSGIPAGSSGAAVADKVGNLGASHSDMAIVYSPKTTYVLTIMTENSSVAAIKDLSQQIYSFYNP